MSRGIGAGCLAAAVLLFANDGARAGDPAIREPNGLFMVKLGYERAGAGDGNRVFNGTGSIDDFRQCRNNDCEGHSLVDSIVVGDPNGAPSGFAGLGGGQFALPVGHSFGLQTDGELGGFHGAGAGDATLHAFWAGPAIGLAGPVVNCTALSDAGYLRAGGEGQFYWNDVTFYGSAGYQWADSGDKLLVDSGPFGCGYVAWYPFQSLMLLAGGGTAAGEGAGFGQAEWRAFEQRAPGFSFVAEGFAGSDDSAGAFAGMRYHFGTGNSLEMRHRHELPLRQTSCGMEQFSAPGADIFNVYAIE